MLKSSAQSMESLSPPPQSRSPSGLNAEDETPSDSPLYSVIIPTFNRQHYLKAAIDSVLAQGYPHLEIVVVDDGSSDQTQDVLKPYSDRIHYLYQPNRGPAAARNLGLQYCKGELIALLDSDDVWCPNKIATELTLFAAHPEAGAIAGDATTFLRGYIHHPSLFHACGIRFEQANPHYFSSDCHRLAIGPLCSTSSMVFRRETLTRLGHHIYDPALHYCEDWDLEFRLFASCPVLLHPTIVSVNYQYDDGTRHYSLPDQTKSADEARYVAQLSVSILRRYYAWDIWSPDFKAILHQQMDTLISTYPYLSAPQSHQQSPARPYDTPVSHV